MTLQWLISWWNLIFVLPFGLALLYLGLYTVSGVTFGDADADVHLDADADADIDHDLDGPHVDADTDHEVAFAGDADGDGDSELADDQSGDSAPAIHWLGIGQVPLSVTLMVLLMLWGWSGFVTNYLLAPHMARSWQVALVSVPLALAVSLSITQLTAGAIARWMPLCDTTARRRHELLGSVGQAVFTIDDRFGMVSVRDDQGDLYQLPCRIDHGTTPVAKGGSVKLVAYSARQNMFRVVPWEIVPPAPPPAESERNCQKPPVRAPAALSSATLLDDRTTSSPE